MIDETRKSIGSIIVFAVLAWSLYNGVGRVRDDWNARSWRRFRYTLTISLTLLAISLAMAFGVDYGVYNGMSRLFRRAYFTTMSVMCLAGVIPFGLLVGWLRTARSGDQLEFPKERRLREAREAQLSPPSRGRRSLDREYTDDR